MTAPILADGTIVNATDHWNPMAAEANATAAGLATEITNRSNAVAAINTRLNSNIAGGGISDLPTWKTTIDNRTTDASTGNAALGTRMTAAEGTITSHTGSIATLNTRTTDASTGNTALGTRLTTVETRTTNATSGNTGLDSRLTTVENRTTNATTGNTALGARVSSLEAASAAVGAWVAITAFFNSWGNRPGGTFYPLRVRLLPGANVQIVGTLGVKSAGAASNEKLFELPSSTYYPPFETILPFLDNGARAVGLKIQADGQCFMYLTGANSGTALNINNMYASATAWNS